MTLVNILEQLKDKKAEAAIIPEEADPSVRAGVEAIQRNAVEAVKQLERAYSDEVINHVAVLGVSGPYAAEFASVADKAVKVITVDFQAIVERLTNNLQQRNSGPSFNQHVYFTLMDELNKVKLELGISRMPQIKISNGSDSMFDRPIKEAVAAVLSSNYGNELFEAYTRNLVSRAAYQAEFSGAKLPVVVYNYTGTTNTSLFPSPVMTFDASSQPTQASVKSALSSFKQAVTGKSNKTSDKSEPEQNQE